MKAMRELMNTREVADYLRIKERKVYDLVHTGGIPCTRLTGKCLFSKTLVDLWVMRNTHYDRMSALPWRRRG
jgi:putative molybdopterin biosynthesis protein